MDQILKLVIDQLGWGAEKLQTDYQESGLTNRNYVVTNGDEKVVVRASGAHTALLGINRHAEQAAMKALGHLAAIPGLVYFDAEQGHMITRFIAGRTWETPDLVPNIDRVGALLRRIHTAAEIDYEFSPYRDIERWIKQAQNNGQPLPESLERLLNQLNHIEASRAAVADNFRGLCHNDPFANNFRDGETLRLLDWEFAGMGDVMYDLACIGQSMTQEEQAALLQAYFGYSSQELLETLQVMDYVVSFWNAMWATTLLDPSSTAPQGFDYAGLANYLFRKMEKAAIA